MKKLNKILLIDDDHASNYLHEMVLKRANLAEEVMVIENSREALSLLKTLAPSESPEIIFLDLNMPVMGGWAFLDEYSKHKPAGESKIIILTASINPFDEQKGKNNPYISGFVGKPLNSKKLNKILDTEAAVVL